MSVTVTKEKMTEYADMIEYATLMFPKGELSMVESTIKSMERTCGTVHCVAGWYLIGATNALETYEHRGGYVGYLEGVAVINEHFGFECLVDGIESWAKANPELWGNTSGAYMFSSEDAYDGATTIQDVVAHIRAVARRLP